MTDLILPLLIGGIVLAALFHKTPMFSVFIKGAREGLDTAISILPSLVALLTAVSMLRASGAVEALARLLEPALSKVGLPAETLMLMLIKPFSGSGALATGADIMREFGTDSFIGRVAAVMLGSSETTFYTISVYFGAAGISKTPRRSGGARRRPRGVFHGGADRAAFHVTEGSPCLCRTHMLRLQYQSDQEEQYERITD